MELQTALDLKSELRGIPSAASASLGGFTKVAGQQLPIPKNLGIALGVATGTGSSDFKLAVRTTRTEQAVASYVNTLGLITSGDIDVQHVGDIEALPPGPTTLPWRGRCRPLRAGFSIGHVNTTAGTIGAFVEKSGVPHILSNNHVLALCNTAQHGDVIVQPGPFDGGQHPNDSVSRLGGFVPLQPTANFVDCALGVLDLDADLDFSYNGHALGVPVQAQLGMSAWKVGRTTGVTQGQVSALALDDLPVRISPSTVVYFDDQIELTGQAGRFSDGGDSGSLILDQGNNPFGLLFAGSKLTGKTFANHLHLVLQLTSTNLLR